MTDDEERQLRALHAELAMVDRIRGDATQRIIALEGDKVRLEAENAALREIAQAMASAPLAHEEDANYCLYCEALEEYGDRTPGVLAPPPPLPVVHAADCLVMKARALLAKDDTDAR